MNVYIYIFLLFMLIVENRVYILLFGFPMKYELFNLLTVHFMLIIFDYKYNMLIHFINLYILYYNDILCYYY